MQRSLEKRPDVIIMAPWLVVVVVSTEAVAVICGLCMTSMTHVRTAIPLFEHESLF